MGRPLLGWRKGGRGRLIEVAVKLRFYLQYYTENTFGTLITGCLIGDGRLMGGRLKGVRLYLPRVTMVT